MKVEILKVILLIALFVVTVVCGFLPVKLVSYSQRQTAQGGTTRQSNRKRYKHVFSCLSCFSAGVFLATCLLDLFPDVRQNLSDVLVLYEVHTGFPVPEFVMVFGLFIILITEQIVLEFKEKHLEQADTDKKPLLHQAKRKQIEEDALSFKSDLTISGIEDDVSRFREYQTQVSTSDIEDSFSDSVSEDSHYHQHHQHNHNYHDHNTSKGHSQSVLRSILLTVALSLHSIFEGLAIGLARKETNILTITSAIILHKCTLSLSLGINLSHSKLHYGSIIRSLLFFSLAAPIGIGIGILIIDLWDSLTSSLIQGLLQGIACGTFLYITFFEIFPSEFNNNKGRRLCKVLFVLFGFSVVCIIMFLNAEPATPIDPCSDRRSPP
ncbi:zinc transporter ZIP1-like [Octopus sinensis]|uniref:Zinc transporter ZIP1-like n=1 Tax=Octopus sinensis TaxID=2607531 RepID=A0A6P7TA41_9MOLL|nr:zinc transporter ZIP1-like [Octopus sinensis]